MVIYIVKDLMNVIGLYADEEKACNKAFEINRIRQDPEFSEIKEKYGLAFVYSRPVVE